LWCRRTSVGAISARLWPTPSSRSQHRYPCLRGAGWRGVASSKISSPRGSA
jgi:hypothetical protein